jgi:hypothetical protein
VLPKTLLPALSRFHSLQLSQIFGGSGFSVEMGCADDGEALDEISSESIGIVTRRIVAIIDTAAGPVPDDRGE